MIFRRWATKKTAGSTKNGRDSNPKYLGVKKFGGEVALIAQLNHTSDHIVVLHYIFLFLVCFAEGDTWEHYCSSARHPVPSWRLCWNGEGSHPFCLERRECAV